MGGWVVLGTPVYTLAGYKGMGDSPRALRKAGLAKAVGAESDLGDVELPRLKEDIWDGRAKNLEYFRGATKSIYSETRSLEASRIMIVGGECSETVGVSAGLAEVFRGKPGMLWLDAHGDFNTPETSPSGYIGGMCLAMACGRTPGVELGIEDSRLSLGEERLVHVGSRALDQTEVAAFNDSPAKLYTSQQVRKSGAADVAEEVARHLDNRSDWAICHLDVDVVDPEFIPSVNYPTPGGLTPGDTSMIIRKIAATGKLKAIEVTAYNASKDRRGSSAQAVLGLLRAALA